MSKPTFNDSFRALITDISKYLEPHIKDKGRDDVEMVFVALARVLVGLAQTLGYQKSQVLESLDGDWDSVERGMGKRQ